MASIMSRGGAAPLLQPAATRPPQRCRQALADSLPLGLQRRRDVKQRGLGSLASAVGGRRLSPKPPPPRRGPQGRGGAAVQASMVKPAFAVAGSALQRVPAVLLIPSCVAAIVYALMGLEGLVRYARNRCKKLLKQPEDVPGEDNWSSSRVRKYVLPYLKPVIIWAAIFVMCGAFDRLPAPYLLNKVKAKAVNVLRVFASVFSVTYCITVLLQQMQAVVYKPVGTTEQVGKELAMQTIEAGIWFLGFALGMELLGVASNSFITAGGIGTLVFTFAGKEIVGNALSGMTIQATKPFTVGDWISIMVNGHFVEGHVEAMGWWQLTLKTFERESSRIANQQVINSVITNVTAKTHWRFKSYIHLYLFTPGEQVQSIVMDIRKLLAEHQKIEHRTLHRRVFYDGHNISVPSKDILVSCYFQTRWQEEYQKLKEELIYNIERIIRMHGSRYATPIRTHDYTAGRTPPSMSPSGYDSPTQRLFLAESSVYKNPSSHAAGLGVVDVTPSPSAAVDVTASTVVVTKPPADSEKGAASREESSKEEAVVVAGVVDSKNGPETEAEAAKSKNNASDNKEGEVESGKKSMKGNEFRKESKDELSGGGQVHVVGEQGPVTNRAVEKTPAEAQSKSPQDGALERELAQVTAKRAANAERLRAESRAAQHTDRPGKDLHSSEAFASWGSTNLTLNHLQTQYSTPEEAAAAASAFSAAAAEAAAAAQALLDKLHAPGGQTPSSSDPPRASTSASAQSDTSSAAGKQARKSSVTQSLGPRLSNRPEASQPPKGVLEPLREVESMSDVPYRGIGEATSPGREWSKHYFAGDRQVARGFAAVSEFEHLHELEDEEDLRVSADDEVEDLGPMSEEEVAAWREADSVAAGGQASTRLGSSEAPHSKTDGQHTLTPDAPLKEKLAGLETMGLSRSDITLLGIAIDKTGRQSAVLDSAFDPTVSPTQLAQRSAGGLKTPSTSQSEAGGSKSGGEEAQEAREKEPASVLVGKEGASAVASKGVPSTAEQLG